MTGVGSLTIVVVVLGLAGAGWIYYDGRKRGKDTADMWAVGFFVAMFVPPVVGAAIVGLLYPNDRNRGGRPPTPVSR